MEFSQLEDKYLDFYVWNNGSEVNFLSLFNHNKKYYFTHFHKGEHTKQGVCIGRVIYEKQIWRPVFKQNQIAYVYLDDVPRRYVGEHYRNYEKLKVHEIIESMHRIENLQKPTHIEPSRGGSWHILTDVWKFLADDMDPDWKNWRSFSSEDFVKNEITFSYYWGKENVKRCLINPFVFEENYYDLVLKSKEKKWWHFFDK